MCSSRPAPRGVPSLDHTRTGGGCGSAGAACGGWGGGRTGGVGGRRRGGDPLAAPRRPGDQSDVAVVRRVATGARPTTSRRKTYLRAFGSLHRFEGGLGAHGCWPSPPRLRRRRPHPAPPSADHGARRRWTGRGTRAGRARTGRESAGVATAGPHGPDRREAFVPPAAGSVLREAAEVPAAPSAPSAPRGARPGRPHRFIAGVARPTTRATSLTGDRRGREGTPAPYAARRRFRLSPRTPASTRCSPPPRRTWWWPPRSSARSSTSSTP